MHRCILCALPYAFCMQALQSDDDNVDASKSYGAAGSKQQVSSLQQKCQELATLPRSVFMENRNAAARRDYSLKKKQRKAADMLFERAQKALNHADSCFFSKKQLRMLTDMCLQQKIQSDASAKAKDSKPAAVATAMAAAAAAAKSISINELKTLLKANDLDDTGLKQALIQRVHSCNLTDQLEDPQAAINFMEAAGLLIAPVEAPKEAAAPAEEASAAPAEEAAAAPAEAAAAAEGAAVAAAAAKGAAAAPAAE